jgi:hypothetical protein
MIARVAAAWAMIAGWYRIDGAEGFGGELVADLHGCLLRGSARLATRRRQPLTALMQSILHVLMHLHLLC